MYVKIKFKKRRTNDYQFIPRFNERRCPSSGTIFIEHFQFQETFRSDWYISLKNIESGFELAFIDSKHGTVPQAIQSVNGAIVNALRPFLYENTEREPIIIPMVLTPDEDN